MPRPRKSDAGEVKRRSRTGCWPCKGRKVKCGEERPTCSNCKKNGVQCDYSIRLNWEGRRKKKPEIGGILDFSPPMSTTASTPAPASLSPTIKSEPGLSTGQGQMLTIDARLSMSAPIATGSTPRSASIQQRPLPSVPPIRSVTVDGSMMSPNTTGFMSMNASPDKNVFHQPRPRSFSEASQSTRVRPHALNLNAVNPLTHFHDPFQSSQSELETINELASPAQYQALSPIYPHTPGAFSDSNSAQFSSRPSMVGGLKEPEPTLPRLSVNSLLSDPPTSHESCEFRQPAGGGHVLFGLPLDDLDEMTFHGIDRGHKDLDIDKNDDQNAISTGDSPVVRKTEPYHSGDNQAPAEFGFGLNAGSSKQDHYYYRNPVPIYIPRSCEPLPQKLRDNPMNLLYFHHFLNHTAHALVPHDDPNSNPFRTILPLMAVKNDNLLSLLLAYSASHRARLLKQPEPATRIAHWVEDIFPAMRKALNDPTEIISNANLASAIMLASLEIISPRAFGYGISWQKHLSTARELITARPGGLRSMQARSIDDPLCSFLWSWFAYLDVLGSLSGARGPSVVSGDSANRLDASAWLQDYEEPSPSPSSRGTTTSASNSANDAMSAVASSPQNTDGSPSAWSKSDPRDEIDCIMGFTTRCVAILARIADLARRTDVQRIAGPGRLVPNWQPTPEMVARARRLEEDLGASLARPHPPCQRHPHEPGMWDDAEIGATNEAFHFAGLVVLYRRVLGKPTEDPDVQGAVKQIHRVLQEVKRGGRAEACLIFPLFTAGCDSLDKGDRQNLLERITTVEGNGMTQVRQARKLLQKVWAEGQPWETLISTEFIG